MRWFGKNYQTRILTDQELTHMLDAVEMPSLPAGLATRAANEALLRAGRTQGLHARAVKPTQLPRLAPAWAGIFALLVIVLSAWPRAHGPSDVSHFMHSMDRIASRTNQELRDADDVLGMLTVANATSNQPAHADEDGTITGDELINTLFDNDAAEDANGASL